MINGFMEKLSSLFGFPVSGFARYMRNTLWFFLERFGTMLIGVIVGIAVARYLEPYNYGVIQYGFTLYAIAVNFGTLGLDDLIIRDALKYPEKEGEIFGTAFLARLTACIVSFVGCFAFAFFTTEPHTLFPVVLITAAVLFQPLGILSLYFQMKVKGRLRATAIMAGYSFAAAAKIVLILIKAPLIYFAAAMAADTIVAMILFLVLYLRENNFKGWKFDGEIAAYFLKTGWPLLFIMIFGTIYTKIDLLLVKNMIGNDALGVYSAAVRLTEVWYYIPVALSLSLFPAIVNAKNEAGIKEYESRVEKILRLLAFGSVCLGIFVSFTSGHIINILYKSDYVQAGPVLAVFIWCLLFVSFNTVTLKWLMMENEILLGLYRSVAGVAINLMLNYYFIKYYGIKGAAVGTLLSYAFFAYFIDLFSKKTRELFIVKTKSLFFPAIFLYKYLKNR